MLFLSQEELTELTGRKRKASQIRWLQEHGYLYEVDANGKPKVLTAHVLRKLGGEVECKKPTPKLRLP